MRSALSKRVFICLPVNGFNSLELMKRQNDICNKVKAMYPAEKIELLNDLTFADREKVFYETDSNEMLVQLSNDLSKICNADLIIFGFNWTNSKLCNMILHILEEYGRKEFRFEWELDLASKLKDK